MTTSNASSTVEPHINPVVSPSTASPSPTTVSNIITFFFSLSALRDWVKLIVLGGFFETCRRIVFGMYSKLISSFWMNAYFEDQDPCYSIFFPPSDSLNFTIKKSRDVQISTQTYGAKSSSITLDGEDNYSSQFKSYRKLSYLPSLSVTYSLWYKGCYMNIIRTQQETRWYGDKENTLQISLLTRDRDILVQLLQEARQEYMAAQEHHMCIFVNDSMGNCWSHVASRAKRSMTSIILDPGVKELLLKDARDFLESKAWYFERGIPYRRGYLLWGAPGSGKSSLIHALAGELGLDVYVLSLGKAGLDDSSLNGLINQLPERCIALMEDVDAVFTHGLSRDSDAVDALANLPNPSRTPKASTNAPSNNRVTLSGLLNALDGVSAQEGRILFATTNKYSSLDSALRRPGRMDVHIEFKLASKYQARELFLRFFNPGDTPKIVGDNESDSGDSIESADSGYASTHDNQLTVHSSFRENKISIEKLKLLADDFAEAIPEYAFSMAALQGYLMMYKTQPSEAVEQIAQTKKAGSLEEEKETMEQEVTKRVEKAVREQLEREKLEKELMEKVEREMTTRMESWLIERPL
ncbi:P-loop containing nucleoside triphosphate hydrolase protein [Lentinula lateritia]|uniref:P-loop containing nucleoside triphosphate hydrolase protein n=1 Tax=Lentinula aff. lateritia TaxID=2804960 RepID=A0ACC1U394_9AGAR|nr:P-loop containing nucleoside triphosphate hydrolase protein [Lentinula aff. lateritia]KAJ3849321.1 P-loop containing nucleoside triphosphate hydrolase protein [Lentinula lateritia]